MRTLASSRVWVVGGAVVGLLLVLATYLLVVAPARTESATVRSQVDDASLTQATLRQRLRALETAASDLSGLQAQGAAAVAALPATADTPGLVRRVQDAAVAHRSVVTSLGVGAGTVTAVAGVWQVPVTAAVTGTTDDLLAVVAALTSPTGRVVSVRGATFASDDTGTTLTLDLVAYCSSDPGLTSTTPAGGPATAGSDAAAPAAVATASDSGAGTTS